MVYRLLIIRYRGDKFGNQSEKNIFIVYVRIFILAICLVFFFHSDRVGGVLLVEARG